MAEVARLVQPAEMQQAESYKAILHQRQSHLDDELAAYCVALAKLQDSGASNERRRLHQLIGKKRREEFELDCLLQALDQRFFSSPAMRTRPVRCFDIEIAPESRCWRVHIPEIDGLIKAGSRDEAEMMAREHIAVTIGAPIAEVAVQVVTGS